MARRRDAPSRRSAAPARRGREHEWLHGQHCIAEALAAGRRPLHALWLRDDLHRSEFAPLVAAADKAGVPVKSAAHETLRDRVGEAAGNWQGALLEAGPIPEHPGLGPLLRALPAGPVRLLALDGVEDPQNVGAIARVADAAGFGGLIVTERRAPPLSTAVSRASAGAIEWLPVARVANLGRALDGLKAKGIWVLGADLSGDAELWEATDRVFRGDLAVVVGAEGRGLRPSTRSRLDHALRIPMRGRVASMNVATATAVLLFEIARRDRAAAAETR